MTATQRPWAPIQRPWAMVTGATAGIGHATSLRLAQAGYNLILVGRRSERLTEIKRSLMGQYPIEVADICIDLREYEKLPEKLQNHPEAIAQLSVLINNAGLAKGTERIDEADLRQWEEMIETNVLALMAVTRFAIGSIKKNQGDVVHIGSVAGRWVYPGGAVYCASKFAVRAFAEGMRLDLNGSGVRVTNIEPGMVETEFSQVRFGDADKAKAIYRGMTPLTAEDIADTIMWCLNRPRHINIQELVVYPTDQASVTVVHRRGEK